MRLFDRILDRVLWYLLNLAVKRRRNQYKVKPLTKEQRDTAIPAYLHWKPVDDLAENDD